MIPKNTLTAAVASLLVTSATMTQADMVSFQNGVNSYTGTADSWIATASSTGSGDETGTNYGSDTSLKVETDQSNGQGMIRFDAIFGNGPGQIPLGSTITSATLSIKTLDGGFAATPSSPAVHRMLVAWDESAVTWNSMVNGIQADGTDTLALADDVGGDNLANGDVGSWDVTASVQAWSSGNTNNGWALLGTTGNGWDASTSESGTVADRPVLSIEFSTPQAGAPTLLGSNIVDDQSGGPVSVNTVVQYTLTFSEDMDAATVTVDDFDNAGTAVVSVNTVTETAPGVFLVGVTATSAGTLQLRVPIGAVLADPDGTPLSTTVAIVDDTIIGVEGKVEGPFTIAMLPDTQHYSDSAANIYHFNNQTRWIIDHRVDSNIVMVSHLGDIVETGSSLVQWERADAAMSTLDTVPVQSYGAVLGNHDYNGGNTPDAAADNYITYFGAGRYAGRHWYGDDSPDKRNHYHHFLACGREYLHLVLEYQAASPSNSDAAALIAWAQSVIDAHPDVPTILSTHEYIGGNGSRTAAGDAIFNSIVKSNPQIFMVLGGHVLGEAHSIAQNDAGQDVFQILADYQGYAEGGMGWMQLFDFDEQNSSINVRTYSPSLNEYQTDANSQYSFSMDFNARLGAVGSGPWLAPAEPTDFTDQGATVSGELIHAGADNLTLVWALTDEGDTTIADWTSAPGGGSHSFGTVAEDGLVSHIFTGLPGDSKIHYRFVATAGTDVNWSSVKAFATGLGGLPAPAGMAATAGNTITLTKVDLSWNDGFANETGFLIQRSTDPGFSSYEGFILAANATAYIDLTTKPNTTYYYRIAGAGTTGSGTFSEAVSITTGNEPSTDTLVFREGEDNGRGVYGSTLDINPRGGGNPALSYGASATINIEDDPGQEDGQGLIRFSNLFGDGDDQIPAGSTIISATLQLTTLGTGNADTNKGPAVHRMLMSWDESDANGSWNHFVGGVDFNDIEAATTPDDSLSAVAIGFNETVSIDVTTSLQVWSAGATNHGWVVMGNSNNRWDIHSSESSTLAARPALTVIYDPSGNSTDYIAWASGYPGADLDDPDGDNDGDGLSNNKERIWGLNPTQPSSMNPISVPVDSAAGTFSYTRRNPSLTGASFTYERSSTLEPNSWTVFIPAVETPDGTNPVETVAITVPSSFFGDERVFFRVVASE